MTFILFAFIVNMDQPGYKHIGWYTDAAKCRAVVRQINSALPHVKGVIGKEYALCRCFSCGAPWP